jgi:RNA polymerase sigma-32 factor
VKPAGLSAAMAQRHTEEGGSMYAKKNYGLSGIIHLPAVRDTTQSYLVQIRKFPLLSTRQNTALAVRYWKTGNQKFASSLVTSNLRLVVKIALEYHRKWTFDLMDIIQEGNMGLIQAIKKYDPFRGVKFSYYAAFWIKAFILKFIIDNARLVKIGTSKTERMLFYNLRKEKTVWKNLGLILRLNVLQRRWIRTAAKLLKWSSALTAAKYPLRPYGRTAWAHPVVN